MMPSNHHLKSPCMLLENFPFYSAQPPRMGEGSATHTSSFLPWAVSTALGHSKKALSRWGLPSLRN
jgi:hypothetical protein